MFDALVKWFSEGWRYLQMSDRERYLAGAIDLADLEMRLRRVGLRGL